MKWIVFVVLSICLLKKTLAQSSVGDFRISPQYSFSEYTWSVAGDVDGNNPNVMSELKWRNVERYGVSVAWQIKLASFRPTVFFSGEKTISGYANDVDYAEDNRQGVNYNAFFSAGKGHFYEIHVTHPVDKIEGLSLGISFSDQSLHLKHDDKLSSSYRPRSLGIVALLSKYYAFNSHFFTEMNFRLALSRFFANASWELREDLKQPVSFSQYAWMGEFASRLGVGYNVNSKMAIILGCELSRAYTTSGDDYLFFANGDTALTQFNGFQTGTFRVGFSITRRLN